VGNRGFVWSYPEYVPGQRRVIRTDIAVLYVGDEAEKQALLLSEPEVFFTTSTYDWSPLVMVRLGPSALPGCGSWSLTPGTCGLPPSWRYNIRSSVASATSELRARLPTLTAGAQLTIQVLDRTHLIRQ
jgi:hypothetical protein